jgi:predicted nucleic acid-binding protein
LPEPDANRAKALQSSGEAIIAPDLVFAEIGNAVWKRAISGEFSTAMAIEAVSIATRLYSALVPMSQLADRAIEIAIELKHPINDCFYLALAERERATLISADRRLIAAARRAKGIEIKVL